MAHYRPSLVEPDRPDKSVTIVRTPSGTIFDVTDGVLAAALGSGGLRAIAQHQTACTQFFDAHFPIDRKTLLDVPLPHG
jgi:hypothetical protein